MSDTTEPRPAVIKTTEHGPLRVKGPVTLVDADGTPYEVKRKTFFLCRCGHSTTKPFCDGSHARVGFEAAERAAAPTGPTLARRAEGSWRGALARSLTRRT